MVATRKNKKSKMNRKYKKSYKMRIQYGCSKKNRSLAQKGGSSFLKEFSSQVLPPVPPALVGPAWSPTNMGSNHYALNKYDNQVDRNPIQERSQINLSVNPWGKMWGGKKRKGGKGRRSMRKGKQKGGSIINKLMPSDLLNVGRYASSNAGNIYNGYNGYAPSVSPLPWNQPNLLKPSIAPVP
jgi:hypothetical protein